MSRHLDIEFMRLQRLLLHLAGVAEESVLAAVKSIHDRNASLARKVIEGDANIDEMEIDVEEECLKVLALHQPVAGDLRFIVAVLKINNDLERIADLAVNIAERSINLASKPPIEIPFDLFGMAHSASSMLKNSLNAMINLDSDLATQVCTLDDEVDAVNREAFDRIQTEILKAPHLIDPLIQLLSVSRHIERIADLATNIAEDVIYLARGQIVRHRTATSAGRPQIRLA